MSTDTDGDVTDRRLVKEPEELSDEELVSVIANLDHEVSEYAETFAAQLGVDYDEVVEEGSSP